MADGTSPVRASLREDPGTLSGFNGQCPLRRKFRATFLAPKFARSQRTRHRGFHSPPECRVYHLEHASNPEEHVSYDGGTAPSSRQRILFPSPPLPFSFPFTPGWQVEATSDVAKPQRGDVICKVETTKRVVI